MRNIPIDNGSLVVHGIGDEGASQDDAMDSTGLRVVVQVEDSAHVVLDRLEHEVVGRDGAKKAPENVFWHFAPIHRFAEGLVACPV